MDQTLDHVEDMPRTHDTITLDDAKANVVSRRGKGRELGDRLQHRGSRRWWPLSGLPRKDGALIGSIDLAIHKAVAVRLFDKATSDLAEVAQSVKPLLGIQESNAGRVVIFSVSFIFECRRQRICSMNSKKKEH
jgi:hypothetical protein